MKPSGPGLLFVGSFKITDSISILAIGGRSQDGRVGGRGVCISPQLGHLPEAGGGPLLPGRWEEPPSKWVGDGVEVRGRRSGGQMGLAPLRGGWRRGGVLIPEGPSGVWRIRVMQLAFPLPNQAPGSLPGSQDVSSVLLGRLWSHWP